MEVLVLGHREVQALLPMAECVEVMAAALANLARGKAEQPLRHLLRQPDGKGLLGLMPASLDEPRTIGSKIITVFPGNLGTRYESHQGVVLLFECEHGRLLAVVDAGAITAIRTAAVSGVATRVLAREGANDLAILGSGTQALEHLRAMRAVRPISRVRVWSRNGEHATGFVERVRAEHDLEIAAVPSANEAVEGADVVCTTTGSADPIVQAEWLAPGAHINAVGACTPNARELDSATVARSRLIVDRRESVLNEAGDYLFPLHEGVIDQSHIAGELGEVLIGHIPGRRSEGEITLFKSLGLAVEDLAAAHYVYRKAQGQGIGTSVDFCAERSG